ncbi:MAG TPA: hypothetical protein VIL63_05995, partial [Terriglobales bacterium]
MVKIDSSGNVESLGGSRQSEKTADAEKECEEKGASNCSASFHDLVFTGSDIGLSSLDFSFV